MTPPRIPARSRLLLAWFRAYARRYVARHFHAARRTLRGEVPAADGPLLIVLNHPSWWDPLFCTVLADLLPRHAHYAVIEAAMLHRYRFFARLGFFGVEPGTASGARTFLRTGLAILSQPGAALWVTAQGGFTDPRARPVRLRPGVGHLARRMGGGLVVPLALEYPFWEERTPEALAHFGPAIPVTHGKGWGAATWTARLAAALEEAQEELARHALARDPGAFARLVRGRSGVGGIYDLTRSLWARLRGREFHREHGRPEP